MKPRLSSALLKAAPALIVIVLCSSVSQAANKYWDTTAASGLAPGSGTWDVGSTALWSTTTAGTALTTFATGDDAFFQTAGLNTVTLGADLTANSITQTVNATATTINSGAGTQITLTTGNLTNSGNSAFIINPNIVLGATATISATNAITLGGILSGGFGISKIGASTLTLNAANTYSGTTHVLAGTTSVAGAAGSILLSPAINLGGTGNAATLALDNTAGIIDRIKDTAPVSLSAGGALSLVGNGSANTVETIGALGIGAGGSTVTLSGTAGGILHRLSAASISRTSLGTALIRGTSLGQSATNATLLTLSDTSGLSFVGTTTANGTSPGSAKNVKIVPWLIGDSSASGPGVNFVTYDTTGGLRPLGSGEYVTLTAEYTGTGENVKAFGGTITAASPSVNSLLFSSAAALEGSGTLSVASGAVALVNSSIASVGSGFSSLSLGNNEGVIFVTGSGSLTINTPINVSGGGGLTKAGGGAGSLVLAAANLYTGPTTVNQGTLAIGSGGSTQASSAVTVASGGTLNVSSGGTVNGGVTAQASPAQATANVVNSGTIAGVLTLNAGTGPASPNANATAIVPTGHAQLNAGSSTGNITNNGQLTLSGSSSITAIGSISGADGLGGFNDANTAAKTLNFAAGSAFSYFRPTNATGTATSILQVAGGGTTSFQWFGYNNTSGGTADVTFNGGTFNIGKIGQNNSGCTTIGNYTVTNGSVLNIAAGGFEHGTWNIVNGAMAFTASIAQSNGTSVAASALQLTVNNSGGGSGSTLSATGSLTLGHNGGTGSVQNNFLTIGNGGTASFAAGLLSVGSTQAATSETNSVNLNGGKLLVGGSTGIVAGTGSGQTKTFNWTAGRLSALQITPGSNFTNPVGGGITTTGLVNSGGVLAPGDVGTAGRTIITGDYTQQAGGTLAIDIAGTIQTAAFQNPANSYDNVLLNGASTANLSLNGNLQVSLVGFTPANGDTFTIIRSAPTTLAVSGAFSNVAFGSRITTQGGEGSFLVSNTVAGVTLSDYQPNAANTYAAWISGFSVGGQTAANDDFDNDNLDNVVENVLGSSPSVYSNGLTQVSASTGSFKFRHDQSNTIATDVTKSYQWSTDLVEWKSSGQANTGGTTATIAASTITDVVAPGNDVIEVTVTVTAGTPAKVFGRLVATKAP
jgi:autotransporter-associated beta strand protein